MYFAHKRPTALVQGRRYHVAFTTHAIRRMQQRLSVYPTHFNSLYDVFAYVQYCHHFEPVTLYHDQPAIALFDECLPAFFSASYVRELVGPDQSPLDYAYRLGYCPLVEEGGFWLAKTFFMPGFISTPEYQVLYRTSLDQRVKDRMLTTCEELSQTRLATMDDWSLLRWFHTHGVPQVIPAPQDLYVREET
jgi:hypothetical protein